jgi:hypothetical protein
LTGSNKDYEFREGYVVYKAGGRSEYDKQVKESGKDYVYNGIVDIVIIGIRE